MYNESKSMEITGTRKGVPGDERSVSLGLTVHARLTWNWWHNRGLIRRSPSPSKLRGSLADRASGVPSG